MGSCSHDSLTNLVAADQRATGEDVRDAAAFVHHRVDLSLGRPAVAQHLFRRLSLVVVVLLLVALLLPDPFRHLLLGELLHSDEVQACEAVQHAHQVQQLPAELRAAVVGRLRLLLRA
jgi:hypothetical protein